MQKQFSLLRMRKLQGSSVGVAPTAKMATRSGHDMLSQIRGFNSKSLNNVQTEITTIEGRKVYTYSREGLLNLAK